MVSFVPLSSINAFLILLAYPQKDPEGAYPPGLLLCVEVRYLGAEKMRPQRIPVMNGSGITPFLSKL
jgi:hypothetical protein